MTAFSELIGEIGSAQFSAHVNIASDMTTFFVAAREHKAVQALGELLKKDPMLSVRVLREIQRFAEEGMDPRYEHPKDAAMAVLVWLLSFHDMGLAIMAAAVVSQARNTWWTKKISDKLLFQTISYAESEGKALPLLRETGIVYTMSMNDPHLNVNLIRSLMLGSAIETHVTRFLVNLLGEEPPFYAQLGTPSFSMIAKTDAPVNIGRVRHG